MSTPLHRLAERGQSASIDFLSREAGDAYAEQLRQDAGVLLVRQGDP